MARRKKSEKTRFRTSTAGRKPQKSRIIHQPFREEEWQKPKDLGTAGTILISFALLIGIIIWNSVRDNHIEPAEDVLRVHFIDVGQGDCAYISCGGENMLIDCGEKSAYTEVVSYLNKEEISALDYVIATHPHSDHMGGMADILEQFEVGEVIIPELTTENVPLTSFFSDFIDVISERDIPLSKAKVGSRYSLGDSQWRIISPFESDSDNLNNCSVGIILSHGTNDFCLTGDAEKGAEDDMLKHGVLKDVEVFKAAHHGGDTSNTEAFMAAVSPEYVVISCGRDNSYGHPKDSVLDRFRRYTEEVYRTDLDGTVVVESDGEKISVITERSMLW